MADKKENNKPILPPKPPKGNYQLWIIFIIISVLLGALYINNNTNLKEIDKAKFESMLKSNDIKKVVLIEDQKIIEITLTEDALENAKYKQEIEKNNVMGANNGPHYKMRIISVDNFDQSIMK